MYRRQKLRRHTNLDRRAGRLICLKKMYALWIEESPNACAGAVPLPIIAKLDFGSIFGGQVITQKCNEKAEKPLGRGSRGTLCTCSTRTACYSRWLSHLYLARSHIFVVDACTAVSYYSPFPLLSFPFPYRK